MKQLVVAQSYKRIHFQTFLLDHAPALLVVALSHKPEDRGLNFRWCYLNFYFK
jgi:hypothetical protein